MQCDEHRLEQKPMPISLHLFRRLAVSRWSLLGSIIVSQASSLLPQDSKVEPKAMVIPQLIPHTSRNRFVDPNEDWPKLFPRSSG
jgi:hypothetical protein